MDLLSSRINVLESLLVKGAGGKVRLGLGRFGRLGLPSYSYWGHSLDLGVAQGPVKALKADHPLRCLFAATPLLPLLPLLSLLLLLLLQHHCC
jgi:hypothetical protein